VGEKEDRKLIVETMRRLFDPSDKLTANELELLKSHALSLEKVAHSELAMLLAVATRNSLLMRGILAYLVDYYGTLVSDLSKGRANDRRLTELHSEIAELLKSEIVDRAKEASAKARKSANDRHEKPGGSKDKRARMREAWWSGKYRTRVECALAEFGPLKISFDTAQKALRNIPRIRPAE